MKYYSSVLFISFSVLLLSWLFNLPQSVGIDVPQGKLNSLSYAPFREGQSPMDGKFPSKQEIEQDLHLLSKQTHSIRTYASAEGTMPEIPALARKYGLTMIQGAWLGGIKKGNELEINELIRSANANPDVVKRVIVGNEVLLRGDLKPEALIEYIRAVKREVKQPVSYADVWSMYMKYPELIKEVDYITIHILPYWEDEPIAVEVAPKHIEKIYQHVQKEAESIAPNKPILIGESGWPSAGKQRGWAVPSVINEAKFIRGLIQVANANQFDYNIVEAINQPWKSELEGVVGANWGLLSVDREQVFPLTGLVYEDPDWLINIAPALVIFLLLAVAMRQALYPLPDWQAVLWLVLVQVLLVAWVKQSQFLWVTSYSDWQRGFAVLVSLISLAMAAVALYRSYQVLTGAAVNAELAKYFQSMYLLAIGFAIYKTLCLAINGRYISYPTVTYLLLVGGMLSLMLCTWVAAKVEHKQRWRLLNLTALTGFASTKPEQQKLLGYCLLATVLALIVGETWAFFISRDLVADYPNTINRLGLALIFTLTNSQLLLWVASIAVLSTPLVLLEAKQGKLK
ncbi:exo-beta-1,3-glucanase [Methylocucumis oryzae]|uniref:Endo-1,3-beta-glucanase btgC n=1 Tax=Methylocucumis oryzae TaxID=1632867 RepID=A0A0F3IHE3_9GAMM|nr:exo-beta-1,3-glucanase [Methylocucumis oryzae]